jgi:hypothetical protein
VDDIRRAESGNKTVYLNIAAWYNPDTGRIHLSLPHTSWFVTTVHDNATNVRGHPHLYGKLARALREGGVPGPAVVETDD